MGKLFQGAKENNSANFDETREEEDDKRSAVFVVSFVPRLVEPRTIPLLRTMLQKNSANGIILK